MHLRLSGYPKDEMIAQISSSLANIGQHIGALQIQSEVLLIW